MGTVTAMKNATKPERVTRTRVDTIEVTPTIAKAWTIGPFQRPLKENQKVRDLAAKIRDDGGVIPGMITLGHLGRSQSQPFLLDGQHRRHAFLLSECLVGYVDVREAWFDTIAEMGEEFVQLNSHLVRITADDVLRGLEQSSLPLTKLRANCPFIGYSNLRRGVNTPMLGMSSAIRCWIAGSKDAPGSSAAAGGVATLAAALDLETAEHMSNFYGACFKAWSTAPEYWKLWGNLNLTLCAWLYQHLVIGQWSSRSPRLSREHFTKCLMSLSADSYYLDWLLGRQMNDRDRGPAFTILKKNFAKRLTAELGKTVLLPQPEWASR